MLCDILRGMVFHKDINDMRRAVHLSVSNFLWHVSAKKLAQSDDICQKYTKNKECSFFSETHCHFGQPS